MNKKAVVVINKTSKGISVIDVQIYNEDGRRCDWASKRFLDVVNAVPFLDKPRIKAMVSRQFVIDKDCILFS